MPRDGNGNYQLPSGNPVVTNTLITSTWANDTLGDLANEMQDSLSRTGRGALEAPLQIVNGTAGGVPGLAFQEQPTSGLRMDTAGDVRVQIAGQDNIRFLSANRATEVWNNDLSTPAWERVFTTPTANVLDANVEKTVQIKRVDTPGAVPASTAEGELGANIGDIPPTLYVGDGAAAKPIITSDFVRFPTGTKMLFYQDTAPTGWMIDQAVDEHMVRLTEGSVAGGVTGGTSGGTYDFSVVFANIAGGGTAGIGNHVLTTAQIPAHTHGSAGNHTHGAYYEGGGGQSRRHLVNQFFTNSSDSPPNYRTGGTNFILTTDGAHTHSSVGSNGAHSHTVDRRAKWAACIIASKN